MKIKRLLPIISGLGLLFLSGCMMITESNAPQKNPNAAAKSYFELGIAYLQRGRYALAESKLQRSIENEPTAEAYNALALLYEEQHENSLAEQTYKQLITKFPDYGRGYLNYNIFLCKYNRRSQIAELATQMAQKGKDIAAIGQIAAGDCAQSKGDNTAAVRHYQQALQYEPYSAGALLPLAEINLKQGFVEKAKKQVDTVNNYIGYSAKSVYLSALIERDLGNKVAERKMLHALRNRFPNSPEAAMILGQ